jgi:hypothetical protein
MLKKEAKWLAEIIYALPNEEVFPILNIGSSTKVVRERLQPWVDSELFEPARKKNLPIIHTDIKDDIGADIVGDLCDPSFISQLSTLKVRSVLCANLLEHVENRQEISDALCSIVSSQGYLFITVPLAYPYHPDPIDTMFRPTVDELVAYFPGFEVVQGEQIDCGLGILQEANTLFLSIKTLLRFFTPFYRPKTWRYFFKFYFPWFFKDCSVTCIVLKKN